jgi:hypothetical protein
MLRIGTVFQNGWEHSSLKSYRPGVFLYILSINPIFKCGYLFFNWLVPSQLSNFHKVTYTSPLLFFQSCKPRVVSALTLLLLISSVFSHFYLIVRLNLYQFYGSFKEPGSRHTDFFFLHFVGFVFHFVDSFPLLFSSFCLCFGLICSSFFSTFRWQIN